MRKQRNSQRRRINKYKNMKKFDLRAIVKVQRLIRRVLLRKKYKFLKDNQTQYDDSKPYLV